MSINQIKEDEEDKKKYIELLRDSSSEETQKARRNTSLISFIIIAMYLLGIQWSGLRISGVNLATANNEKGIIFIALALSIFWIFMFLINHLRDYRIYKIELKNHLHKKLILLKDELQDVKDYQDANITIEYKYKNRKDSGDTMLLPDEKRERDEAYDILENLKHKFEYIYNYSKQDYSNEETMVKIKKSLEEKIKQQRYFIDNDFEPTNKLSLIINVINIILPIFLFYISTLILLKSSLILLLLVILSFSISLVYILHFFKLIKM